MKKPIPFFELYVSFLSIALAIVVLRDSAFLKSGKAIYEHMLEMGSENIWAMSFTIAALIKIVGLVLKMKWMRKLGLTASFFIHGLIGYCFVVTGGYLGAGAFILTALFSMIVIFDVDNTELK